MYEFDEKEEYSLIPTGEYEVILEKAEIKTAQSSGKPYINMKFRIRNDVEQPQQGRVIFESIFLGKNSNQFDTKKLGAIMNCAVGVWIAKYSFADDDEVVQYINGLAMRLTIELNGPDDYHTEDYNQVKYCSYKQTNVKAKTLGGVEEMNAKFDGIVEVIDDSDLPF